MKKTIISITATMAILAVTSGAYCADILGYPIVEKQARFYTMILGVIAVSIALVGISYLCFWVWDMKKKAATSPAETRLRYSGELAAASK